MKRMLLTAATTSTLALALPAMAAAHHSTCHQRAHAHHACSQPHRARHARLLTFGAPLTSTGSSTSAASGAGSTPTPASPTPSTGETAGTVASFTGGVLTITLHDGSTVSGKVSEASEIRCQPSTAPSSSGGGDDEPPSETSGDDSSSHDESGEGSHGEGGSGDDGSGDESGDGSAEGHGESSSCTTAALIPGAVVREAVLSVGGSGALWDHIELVS